MSPTHHSPGTFCWFECATSDAAAATSFYKELFDWGSKSASSQTPYIEVMAGGELGGRVVVPPTTIPHVGRFSVFSEPGGAVVAVIKLEGDHI